MGDLNLAEVERMVYSVKGICIKVHKALGCGLLESAYRKVLTHALRKEGFRVDEEVPINLVYDGDIIPNAFRADLVVNDVLIIEIKAVEELQPVHHLQIGSYLQLTGIPYGLLVNFHTKKLTDGMFTTRLGDLKKRFVSL